MARITEDDMTFTGNITITSGLMLINGASTTTTLGDNTSSISKIVALGTLEIQQQSRGVIYSTTSELVLAGRNSTSNLRFALFGANSGTSIYYGQFAGTTGNFMLQNNGTFTDDGSRLQVKGSMSLGYVAKTANYTITANDYTIDGNGTFTLTLPTAVGCTGRIYVIKNSGMGVLTVVTANLQTIDGSSMATAAAAVAMRVQSNGSNWIII